MLSSGVRVLDFDGSVASQTEFLRTRDHSIIPFRDLGVSARLWASPGQADQIRKRLVPEEINFLTFLGSGDYHYASALLLEQFKYPLSLVVFDYHPDWDRLPPRRGCGAWIARALEQNNIERIILVGVGSSDLKFPSRLTGCGRAIKDGRIVLISAESKSRSSVNRPGARNSFSNPEFIKAIDELPTERVYTSIDKDCLRSAFALTNWEEGDLELDQLNQMLDYLKRSRRLEGADVTGDYSPPRHSSGWKSFCSRFDHPREYTARGQSEEHIRRVNEQTNRILTATLISTSY